MSRESEKNLPWFHLNKSSGQFWPKKVCTKLYFIDLLPRAQNDFYDFNIFFEGSLRGTYVYVFNIPINVTIVKSTTKYVHLIHYTLKWTIPTGVYSLSNCVLEIKKNLGAIPMLKWEIVKKKKTKNAVNIKRGINIIIYEWRRNLPKLLTIIPLNCLIKGRKYLMFVDIKKSWLLSR